MSDPILSDSLGFKTTSFPPNPNVTTEQGGLPTDVCMASAVDRGTAVCCTHCPKAPNPEPP